MIKLNKVNKYYNHKQANEIHVINNCTMEFPEKGMVAIFGESGSGKTSLLNAIGGLDKINNGTILIDDKNLEKNTDDIRNKYIGYIFQNYYLSEELTVYENVAISLRLVGLNDENEIKERVMEILKSVEMDKYSKRYPNTLSGGQKQRVAIARALVKNPEIILADEPTGNLDELNTHKILGILKGISASKLVIIVTHEVEIIKYYCDSIVSIVDGKIDSINENSNDDGYIHRNKREIYLGDLENEKIKINNIEIDFYKDEKNLIDLEKIKIIYADGKLYLEATSGIKVLDDKQEVILKEGKFEKINKINTSNFKMNEFKDIEYRSRNIFSIKDSIVKGFKENIVKQKFGKKLLIITLVLFSVILCLYSGIFGKNLETRDRIMTKLPKDVLYVALQNENEYKEFIKKIDEDDSIRDIEITNGLNNWNRLRFTITNFETADFEAYLDNVNITSDSFVPENVKLLAGRKISKENYDTECLISKELADDLIRRININAISEYDDLIGLGYYPDYYSYGDTEDFTIVGVIDTSDYSVYHQELKYYIDLFNKFSNSDYYTIGPVSDLDEKYHDLGEYEFISKYGSSQDITTVLNLLGFKQEFTKKLSLADDFSFPDFLDWAYLKYGIDPDTAYNEYEKYHDEWDLEYKKAHNQHIGDIPKYKHLYYISDKVILETGRRYYPTNNVNISEFKNYDFSYSGILYRVYSDDLDKTLETLLEVTDEKGIVYPEDFSKTYAKDINREIRTQGIIYIVLIAILVTCLFLIMKSLISHNIKSIGIYRAIGVGKKSIYIKLIVESLTITISTVFASFLASSFVIGYATDFGKGSSMIVAYPFWMFSLVGLSVLVTCFICGSIPILQIIRLTPSEILTKYDI